MSRKLILFAWLLSFAAHVTALPTYARDTAVSQLKVALVTPGKVNDQGWNQMAYDALQRMAEKTGAHTVQITTVTDADKLQTLHDLASKHYDLILCHGYEYGSRVQSIASLYPSTKFVIVAGNVRNSSNITSLVPKLEEATYLLGIAAGGMTKHNVIGAIGGMELPIIKSTFDTYEMGAQSVNPKIKVLSLYVGNFEDKDAAHRLANRMIAQKADFIFHMADWAGKGVFDATRKSQHVYVIGSMRDESYLSPKKCLGSAVINLSIAFEKMARDVAEHHFQPALVEMNIPNGYVSVKWNKALIHKIPRRLMRRIHRVEAQIKSGQIKIPRNV